MSINSILRGLFKGGILGLACWAVAPPLTATIVAIKAGTEISKSMADECNGGGRPRQVAQNNSRTPANQNHSPANQSAQLPNQDRFTPNNGQAQPS